MKRIALFSLLALASCATAPAPAPAGPTAALGELAVVEGATVRPLALLEDSRCPASVRCIWAGQVRIRAEVSSAGGTETRELTLGQPATVPGGSVTLTDVQPAKRSPEAIDQGAYRFTFASAP